MTKINISDIEKYGKNLGTENFSPKLNKIIKLNEIIKIVSNVSLDIINTPKFSFVKKQDLPEKPKTQETISDSNIEAKSILENFSSENIHNLFKISLGLGFEETNEMIKIRQDLVKKMKDGEEYLSSYFEYEGNSMDIISKSNDIAKSQISLLLMKAIIYYEGGNIADFKENINDAIEFAYGMNSEEFDEIEEDIRTIVDKILGLA